MNEAASLRAQLEGEINYMPDAPTEPQRQFAVIVRTPRGEFGVIVGSAGKWGFGFSALPDRRGPSPKAYRRAASTTFNSLFR
ncbi:MAG: hypothetical protein ABI316_01440 [Casimicrobiaceae bacterium]